MLAGTRRGVAGGVPKGRGGGTSLPLVLIASFVALGFIGGVVYRVRQTAGSARRILQTRIDTDQRQKEANAPLLSPKGGIYEDRRSLIAQIEAWNLRAKTAGLAPSHLISLGSSSPSFSSIGRSVSPSPAHALKLEALHGQLPGGAAAKSSAIAAAEASGEGGCDKEPADKSWPMMTAAQVEKDNPELVKGLKKSAKNNEIMLALANGIMICKNKTICWWEGGNILETFLEIIDHNKITNHLIGVMDDETEAYLKDRPYNYFRVNIVIPESQKNSHPANRVSTIKYTLLKQIISLGYNTLITDMDLVYMKNPFDHLHRDSDIEIQTDGFDETSYGMIESVHDPSMGWGAGGLYIKLFTTNVGCMWVKANSRSYTLMSQVTEHLQKRAGWDQQIFNEYLLRPSHGDFLGSSCSLRVLDFMKFTNSKIFFKSRREQFIPGSGATAAEPLMVHFNYHPDKHRRMLCIVDRYYKGNISACDHLPAGSDPK